AEMAYVGSIASVNPALVRRKDAPAKTVEEKKRISSNVACSGRTSQSYQIPAMLRNLGGFQFKIVCGYPGSAEYVIALNRGEIDMVSSAWNQWRSVHATEIKEGVFVPVIQSGLRRNREIPDVPLMQDIVDDPTSKTIIEFYSAASAIGRALITPPQVPADRLAVLRSAFDKLVKDPEFLREAERAKAEVDPTPGAELQKYVASILNAPKDVIDRANKAMAQGARRFLRLFLSPRAATSTGLMLRSIAALANTDPSSRSNTLRCVSKHGAAPSFETRAGLCRCEFASRDARSSG